MKNGKRRGQKKQKRKGAYDKSGGITYDTAAFAFRTKDILKIRSRPRLEPGSDYHYLVRLKGLEPTRITAREPKSRMSTNSITGAYMSGRVTCRYFIQNKKEEFEKCEIRGLTLSVCDFSAQSAMKSQICICA